MTFCMLGTPDQVSAYTLRFLSRPATASLQSPSPKRSLVCRQAENAFTPATGSKWASSHSVAPVAEAAGVDVRIGTSMSFEPELRFRECIDQL